MSRPSLKIAPGPFASLPAAPASSGTSATGQPDAATLPPDVVGSWALFGVSLGISLPNSVTRTKAHRAALRRAVR